MMLFRSITKFVLLNHRQANLTLIRCLHRNHMITKIAESSFNFKWSSLMITRGIKTTNKKDDSHVEVFEPEYLKETKPKGPQTAKEFADVSSQKVWFLFLFSLLNFNIIDI